MILLFTLSQFLAILPIISTRILTSTLKTVSSTGKSSLESTVSVSSTTPSSSLTTTTTTKYARIYDSRLEFMFGDRGLSATVLGNFSSYGNKVNVNGDVVKQYDPYRACSRSTLGLDSTLAGHIVVIMIKEILPFLAGCVIPYNQAKFARDSQAIGVILNVQSFRGSGFNDHGLENFESLGIPVIVVSGIQAQNMQIMLKKASFDGLQTKVWIRSNTLDIIEQNHNPLNYIDKEAVFLPKLKEFLMPGGHDISVLCIVILMFAVMLLICIFLKMRYMPQSGKSVPDYRMAKQALSKMQVKKFRDIKEAKKRRSYNFVQQNSVRYIGILDKELGLLVDKQPTSDKLETSDDRKSANRPLSSCTVNLDTCAICLEEFKDGEILRVITCGHDFHKNCIDPWLLKNHTCPLCLFNIIQGQYDEICRNNDNVACDQLQQRQSLVDQDRSSSSISLRIRPDQSDASPTANNPNVVDPLLARMLLKGYLRPAAPYYYYNQINVSGVSLNQNQSKMVENNEKLCRKESDFASTSCLNGSTCSSTAFKPIVNNLDRQNNHHRNHNRRRQRKRHPVYNNVRRVSKMMNNNQVTTNLLLAENGVTVIDIESLENNLPSEGYLSDVSSATAANVAKLRRQKNFTKRKRSTSLTVGQDTVIVHNCSRDSL